MKKVLVVLMFVMLVGSFVSGFDYVISDTRQCALPIPLPAKPAQGVLYNDTCFNTEIVRLTDAETESNVTDGYDAVMLRYAKFSPENADGTRVLLQQRYGTGQASSWRWALYNVDKNSPDCYSEIRHDINFGLWDTLEPRWDPEDPNIIWHTREMGLYFYNISDNIDNLYRNFIGDFPVAATYFYTDDEGRPSYDNRYWAWILRDSGVAHYPFGTNAGIFTYDKDAEINGIADTDGKPGEIVGFLDNNTLYDRHGSLNWISVSLNGEKVVIGSGQGTYGTGSYDLDFSNPVYMSDPGTNHLDLAINAEGDEVITGYRMGLGEYYMVGDLNTGVKTRLLRQPWPNSDGGLTYGHISGVNSYNKPGWALFSSYGCPSDPTARCHNYNSFDCNLIFLMELKDVGHEGYTTPDNVPRIWQLAYSNSNVDGCYNAMPMATMNMLGTRVYFKSSWEWPCDGETGCGVPGSDDVIDTYIIELPETWYEDLSGNITNYHDADLDHDLVINRTEIDSYVQRWKGDMTLSLSDIIEAIGIWKAGGTYS
ncbi:MAG: hypothetical protein ABIB79_03305 [archaeon]